MIDALCTTRTATPFWRARSCRSVCVVAAKGSPTTRNATSSASAASRMPSMPCAKSALRQRRLRPSERAVCAGSCCVRAACGRRRACSTFSRSSSSTRFSYSASCDAEVVRQHSVDASQPPPPLRVTRQPRTIHAQNRGVRLKIHLHVQARGARRASAPRCGALSRAHGPPRLRAPLDCVQAAQRDIALVAQAEADHVQHGAAPQRAAPRRHEQRGHGGASCCEVGPSRRAVNLLRPPGTPSRGGAAPRQATPARPRPRVGGAPARA